MEVIFTVRNAYLLRYLEYLFEKKDGKLFVSRTTDFGRLCISHLHRSENPVPVKKSDLNVTLVLPKSNYIPQVAERYWLYYDKFDMKRLNDALIAESNIDFKTYYVSGVECGFLQKDIINAYIESRRLFLDDFDRLKKRSYRSDDKSIEKIRKYLSNKIYFVNKKITDKNFVNINSYISGN